ncbi:MAG: hypothetical protein OHK0013_18130 [Sandaracinaceae bacterium]
MTVADVARLVRFTFSHPLGKRAPLKVAARIARWQLGVRLLGWPAVVPFASGTQLVVERGMTGATGNLYFGLHEVEDMAFVTHALRPGDLFVDVGANIGSYTVLAGGVAKAEVIACEPVPATRERLTRNVALNGLAGRVRVEPVAVSDHEGTVSMTTDRDAMNQVVATGGGLDVRAITLDTLLSDRTPTLIKIDVEGHEAEVIRGAARTLARPELWAVVVEPSGTETESVRRTLEAAGFAARRYDPFTRAVRPAEGRNPHNVLYVRTAAEAAVAERVRSAPAIDLGWAQV